MAGLQKVFISYSHESDQFQELVRQFADDLNRYGIDCIIDQYESKFPNGIQRWMRSQIQESDSVLLVASETYKEKFEGKKGEGVNFEGHLIMTDFYKQKSSTTKYIPVVFDSAHLAHIPDEFKAFPHYDLSQEDGFEKLYRRLTDKPLIVQPPVGELRNLETGVNLEASPRYSLPEFNDSEKKKEQDKQHEPVDSGANKKFFSKHLGKIAGFLGLIAAVITIYPFINDILGIPLFTDRDYVLTVFVHENNDRSVKALAEQGVVMLDYDDVHEEKKINSEGEAVFKGIPEIYRNKEILLNIKAKDHELAKEDTTYKLCDNPKARCKVYIAVETIDKKRLLKGMVQDRQGIERLPFTKIFIGSDSVISADYLGRFKILLPRNLERKTYNLRFEKEGYLPKEYKDVYPGSDEFVARLEKIE